MYIQLADVWLDALVIIKFCTLNIKLSSLFLYSSLNLLMYLSWVLSVSQGVSCVHLQQAPPPSWTEWKGMIITRYTCTLSPAGHPEDSIHAYVQWIPYQPCLLQHITLLLCIVLSHFCNLLFNFNTTQRKGVHYRQALSAILWIFNACQGYTCTYNIGNISVCSSVTIVPWFL